MRRFLAILLVLFVPSVAAAQAFKLDRTRALPKKGHTTSIGQWLTPTFNAADFTGIGAMTWTVESADVVTYAYTVIGKTMIVMFAVGPTTIGGTPERTLRIKIPGGFVAAKQTQNPFFLDDGVASTVVGLAFVASAGTTIGLYKLGSNWTVSTNTANVSGQITFEVQ